MAESNPDLAGAIASLVEQMKAQSKEHREALVEIRKETTKAIK